MNLNVYTVTFFAIAIILLLAAFLTYTTKRLIYPIVMHTSGHKATIKYRKYYPQYAKLIALASLSPIIAGVVSMVSESNTLVLILFCVTSLFILIVGTKTLLKDIRFDDNTDEEEPNNNR